MSTSLTSELHPCSGLRCSVSRKSSVAESRVYAMWLGEKKNKTKETSNSVPKCCQGEKGGGRSSAALSWMLLQEPRESFHPLQECRFRGAQNSEGLGRAGRERWYPLGVLVGGRLRGQCSREGLELGRGQKREAEQWIPRDQTWHIEQGFLGPSRWVLRVRSKWHLSCESRLQGSWERAGEERKKERQKNSNIGKDEKRAG